VLIVFGQKHQNLAGFIVIFSMVGLQLQGTPKIQFFSAFDFNAV